MASNLGLVAAAVLATLLILEAALRLFGLASPIIYRLDPRFGYEPMPSQSSFRLGVRVHINDVGLRDDEDFAALMKGTERILVIGNSVTYGSSLVSQPELFTEVLERELRSRRPGVKVLNAGVAGYSVSQMMMRAPRLVELTAPHHLVLYVIQNDFRRPPVRYPAEGSPQEPLKRPRSALITFMQLSLPFLDGRYGIRKLLPQPLQALWPRGPSPDVPWYDRSRVVEIHIEAVERFLRTVWEPGGHDRANVIAFISPTRSDVLENRPMPNADLVRRFDSLGIQAYDLQSDFHDGIIAAGHDIAEYYHDDIHYRERGNELAGRAVAKHLIQQGFAATTVP